MNLYSFTKASMFKQVVATKYYVTWAGHQY